MIFKRLICTYFIFLLGLFSDNVIIIGISTRRWNQSIQHFLFLYLFLLYFFYLFLVWEFKNKRGRKARRRAGAGAEQSRREGKEESSANTSRETYGNLRWMGEKRAGQPLRHRTYAGYRRPYKVRYTLALTYTRITLTDSTYM